MDCWTRLNECVDASAGAAPCPFQSASLAGKNWAGVQIRLQVQFWAPTRTHMHIHKATRNYKNGARQNEYNESHNDTTNELLPIRNQFVIALWNEKKQNNFFFRRLKNFDFLNFSSVKVTMVRRRTWMVEDSWGSCFTQPPFYWLGRSCPVYGTGLSHWWQSRLHPRPLPH